MEVEDEEASDAPDEKAPSKEVKQVPVLKHSQKMEPPQPLQQPLQPNNFNNSMTIKTGEG